MSRKDFNSPTIFIMRQYKLKEKEKIKTKTEE